MLMVEIDFICYVLFIFTRFNQAC